MIGIRIRPVSVRDLESICSLEQGPSGCRYQAAVFVRQAMTLWPQSFLIAEEEGYPVGFLIGGILPDDTSIAWILRLRVIQEKQRQGIGTAMLDRIHGFFQEQGVRQVMLSCSPSNQGALSLYARAGYIMVRHEAGYFGPGEDRRILMKNLDEKVTQ